MRTIFLYISLFVCFPELDILLECQKLMLPDVPLMVFCSGICLVDVPHCKNVCNP